MYKKIRFSALLSQASLILFVYLLHISFGYPPKLVYIFSALAFFAFIASVSRKVYLVVVLFYALAGMFYAPVGINYGFPDVNSVGSLIYTNSRESAEFFLGISLRIYLFMAALLGCAIIAMRLKVNVRKPVRYWLFAIFFIPAFWSPVKNVAKAGWNSEFSIINSGLPEFRFFYDIARSYNDVMASNSHFAKIIQTPDNWKPVTVSGKYDTYILVIGESVRKDFMQAYGFPYAENTAWMSRANGTLFTDFISAAGATQPSLTNAFTLRESTKRDLNNSLITLAKHAGFETYWLSNQGLRGKYDSPVAMIGKQADHTVFLKEGSAEDRDYFQDENLRPDILRLLAEQSGNRKRLIVIHLMGSHPQPCARTNNQFDKFITSDNISCYVQSIANTDRFLSEIATDADKHHVNWTMIYFSDHGLRVTDNGLDTMNLVHSDEFKQNYQVPFFLTSYDATEQKTVQSRRSGLSMLPFLAQWMGISEPRLSQQCAWRDDVPCEDQSRYISFQNKEQSYDDLPDDLPVLIPDADKTGE
ncbi:MAG: sulfatase-like hydrolase/transferase [Morganella sp. (in: enterobacteria)]